MPISVLNTSMVLSTKRPDDTLKHFEYLLDEALNAEQRSDQWVPYFIPIQEIYKTDRKLSEISGL